MYLHMIRMHHTMWNVMHSIMLRTLHLTLHLHSLHPLNEPPIHLQQHTTFFFKERRNLEWSATRDAQSIETDTDTDNILYKSTKTKNVRQYKWINSAASDNLYLTPNVLLSFLWINTEHENAFVIFMNFVFFVSCLGIEFSCWRCCRLKKSHVISFNN